MKASLKLRDDQNPLLRAKVPLTVLGLPFVSGIAAGDPKELRFDLTTALDYGPAVRLSYRPYNASSPFALAVKVGSGGALGSPAAAPLAMTAEFNLSLLRRRPCGAAVGPAFSVVFKPCLGDFLIKKVARSSSTVSTSPPPVELVQNVSSKNCISGHGDERPAINDLQYFESEKPAQIGCGGGLHRLLSGTEVMAISQLPLRKGTNLAFRWGVRLPSEVYSSLGEHRTAGFSFLGLPQLVMSKASIEHVAKRSSKAAAEEKPSSNAAAADDRTFSMIQRQLEALREGNEILGRGAGSGVFAGRKTFPVAGRVDGSATAGNGKAGNLQEGVVKSELTAEGGRMMDRRSSVRTPETPARRM